MLVLCRFSNAYQNIWYMLHQTFLSYAKKYSYDVPILGSQYLKNVKNYAFKILINEIIF